MGSIGHQSCEKMMEKPTPVGRICVLSDKNKRSLLLFFWEMTSFSKSTLLQREPFLKMFHTINSSPMLITKSVFKLILVLGNYQTCTFPLITTNHSDIWAHLQCISNDSLNAHLVYHWNFIYLCVPSKLTTTESCQRKILPWRRSMKDTDK